MSESLRDEAICSVCLGVLSHPIFLSCAHSFCCRCIQMWFGERRTQPLTCPVCREASKTLIYNLWHITMLTHVITQHDTLLDLSLHVRGEFLRYQEAVTLDAATANSCLVLSDDLRQVCCGKICHNPVEDPQRFAYVSCVLGSPCFSSGRHYWEVEVEEGKEWALGVCSESVDRKKEGGFSSEEGFWVISMRAGAIYSSSITESRISTSPGLSRVGIFLDVELEEIKFFDVRNDALIYIDSGFFLDPLRPFFCPGLPGAEDSSGVLSICFSEIN